MNENKVLAELEKILKYFDVKADIDEPRVYENVIEYDVNMMYPTTVLEWKIDPVHFESSYREYVSEIRGLRLLKTIMLLRAFVEGYNKVKDDSRHVVVLKTPSGGIVKGGPYYVATSLLREFRLITKQMAKKDPKYKAVDNAVKAVLNSVAYGIGSKKDSPMPLGTPYFSYGIFYGTAIAEFLVIALLTAKWRLEGLPCRPVYGDTDSLYIHCERVDDDIRARVEEDVVRAYRVFGYQVKKEGEFKLMIVYKRKQYILIGKDGFVVKGGGPKQFDKFMLPAEVSLVDLFKLATEEEVIRFAKNYVRDASLKELGARVSKAMYQFICMSEERVKQLRRDKLETRLRLVTRWDDVPECYALSLDKGSLLDPVRLPLYEYMLVEETDGKLTFENTGGTEIREAYGYTAKADVGYYMARAGFVGADAIVVLEDEVVSITRPSITYFVRPIYSVVWGGLAKFMDRETLELHDALLQGRCVAVAGDKVSSAGSTIKLAEFCYLSYKGLNPKRIRGEEARKRMEILAMNLIINGWRKLVQPAIKRLGDRYRQIVKLLEEVG